jgi:hypothetical protein
MVFKITNGLGIIYKLALSSKHILNLFLAFTGISLIIYLNYLQIEGWFGGVGPASIGSIEVSYVSMGRFLVDYGLRTWAPFWYLGFPFHLFYTPLLPFLEAFIHNVSGMQLWETYRLITGAAYILGPVSVFVLGWVLSRRWLGGLISGVLASISPSIFYFVLPSTRDSVRGEMAADRFSADFWDPRRFTVLVRWGEGPHLLSLVFLPLAASFFVISLRRRSFLALVTASIFFMLSALSNALGMMGTVLLCLTITFCYFAQHAEERIKTALWIIFLLFLGFGYTSFWYNLSFIANFFAEGGGTANVLMSLFPWGWLGMGLLVLLLFLIFSKFIKDLGIAASLVWFLGLFCVVYVYYASAPAELSNQRLELLPQALRYSIQVDMALSVLIGVAVATLVRFIGKRYKIAEVVLTILLGTLTLGSFIYIRPFVLSAEIVTSNQVDLSKTREYSIAKMLEKNVSSTRGERVFIPGNYGFYLNWFTDIWQHRGALFQAATHPWPDHIHYQMANGDDADIARYWLKAINAKYAVIPTIESSELYHEIKNLQRFDEYELVYNKYGDKIFRVPLLRPSIAKAVNLAQMQEIETPVKADDEERLVKYVRWVERSAIGEGSFTMVNHDSYTVSGKLDEGEALLIQMTADSGWKAIESRTGKNIRTGKDPLGFLMIYPEKGDYDIKIIHTRPWQLWLGYATTLITLVFTCWYGWAQRRFSLKIEERHNGGKNKNNSEAERGE